MPVNVGTFLVNPLACGKQPAAEDAVDRWHTQVD